MGLKRVTYHKAIVTKACIPLIGSPKLRRFAIKMLKKPFHDLFNICGPGELTDLSGGGFDGFDGGRYNVFRDIRSRRPIPDE